jgi:hypothetical protein
MAPRPTSIRLGIVALAAGALLLAGGCSSTATATATATANAAPGGSTPPAASSTAPGPSAPASSAGPVLPGFSLPSDDKSLEALLPSTLCGQAAIKLSMSGASFLTGAGAEFTATLAQLGKTAADVAIALAESDPTKASGCKVSAGVFEVKGADDAQLQTVFLAAASQSETTYTQGSIGGKTVYVDASNPSSKNYAYFKGDGIFFVSAPDDATATTVLSSMP